MFAWGFPFGLLMLAGSVPLLLATPALQSPDFMTEVVALPATTPFLFLIVLFVALSACDDTQGSAAAAWRTVQGFVAVATVFVTAPAWLVGFARAARDRRAGRADRAQCRRRACRAPHRSSARADHPRLPDRLHRRGRRAGAERFRHPAAGADRARLSAQHAGQHAGMSAAMLLSGASLSNTRAWIKWVSSAASSAFPTWASRRSSMR
ncbi:MAG: hypothetical protein WDN44_14860 [Sphingomonas sp.]